MDNLVKIHNMVSMKLNQLIHELKRRGYAEEEVIEYLNTHERKFEDKIPHPRTISKYYNMPEASVNTNCAKPMAFDAFEDVIIEVVKGLPDNYCVSSIYDLLEEKYVDTEGPEKLEKLPGNQQTLRFAIFKILSRHLPYLVSSNNHSN